MAGSSSRASWWIIGVVVLIGIGVGVWFLRPPPAPGPLPQRPDEDGKVVDNQQPLNRDNSLYLVELRNIGLGYLENHHFDDAAETFEEMLTFLPNEPFAVRNLAIARVKEAAEKIDERKEPEQFARAMDTAKKSVQQLEKLEPNSALPEFLLAVLATKSSEPADAVPPLKLATERDPDNATWKFQWFELGRSLREPAEKQAAFEAGLTAAKLAPDNMFVQKEVLAEDLTRLADLAKTDPDAAAAESDEVLAWLERLREPVRVLGISVQVQARTDVVAILDGVIAAIKEKNFQKARNEFFKIKNLLAQETASDADLIHPHPLTYNDPLNYVSIDFSQEFYAKADLPDDTLPKIEVTWKESEAQLPEVTGDVRQLGWLDFDLDGVEDLIELGDKKFVIHRRLPDRSGWEAIPLDLDGGWTGFAAADLDDDVIMSEHKSGEPVKPEICHQADPDFVLYGESGVLLVSNVLDSATQMRRLEPIDKEQAGFGDLTNVSQAKLIDFDHDGDLDLVTIADGKLGLWINLGNFAFQDATDRSMMPSDDFRATAIAAADWDQDSDIDLLVSGKEASGWMENLRHGRMRFHPSDLDWANATQLEVAELDGDGNWDLIVANDQLVKVLFSGHHFAGFPTIERHQNIFESPLRRVNLLDFDNDGGIDVLITRGATASLFRNLGTGSLEEQTNFPNVIPSGSIYFQCVDIDDDGDLDFITASDGKLHLVTNQGGNQNNYLEVQFVAQQVKANEQGASRRVNHYGIGNIVEVKTGTRYQAKIADSGTTRFGIGPADRADIVRIVMTNGVPQNRIDPEANTRICERQVLLTSCPYLYAWNGSRYEFVTDLLWASPLGLKASQSELVPWRDWEYLKIDGAKLQPKDGEYRLQITEELWEAAYFDEVKLIAVDHPAGTEIYTNEKVGSPELAAHRIHTVRAPKRPQAIRDQSGRDWSSQLAERDEVYTRNYDRKLAQGLCEEHYLEFELGELASPEEIKLFLTGWVRPTDTNINVNLDQNPDLPSPTGLALWTPDESGTWREVSPHVGFPNGKTKTIVIDLSNAFAAGDYRLRLVSNREFYWDQAFFTVDDEPVEVREYELPLRAADMHFRGVSRGILPTGDGPEVYDYDELAGIPPWSAMEGRFTRYGDVLPLLQNRDDRLVVCGVGDEMSLAFSVPEEPLPDGWVRDFVLYDSGWVKDCLLNTWEGQRVEPLPFAGMHGHDYWTGRPEETGDYAEYLRRFQTRRQTDSFRSYVRRFSAEEKRQLPLWERNRRTGD